LISYVPPSSLLQAFDKSDSSQKGVLDFLSRVSMGDQTMHKLPSGLTAPAA
jgi:hypothetical protein